MKIKQLAFLAGLFFSVLSGNVLAQNPSITVGTDSGSAGTQVTVPLTWAPGASTYLGVEFKVGFVDSILTFDSCSLNAPYSTYALKVCQLNGSDVEVGLIDDIVSPSPVPGGELGSVTFTIAGDAPVGSTALIVNNVVLPGNPTVDTTDGSILVLGPTYSSNPAPGPVNVGSAIIGDTDPQTTVNVSNPGAGTLAVTCTDTTGMGSVFTVNPNTEFTVDAGAQAQAVAVSCSSAAVGNFVGQMSCEHNDAGQASPLLYSLSCAITPGPQPAYSSVPAAGTPINLEAPFQGDPITPAMVTISNDGDDDTTLDGTCSFGMAPPQLTVVDGVFSVATGDDTDVQTISCDSSVEGVYSATLSCTHDGSNASPATYAVSCDVGAPRPAVFASTPASPATVDMTVGYDGGEAVVGDTIPDSVLSLSNTAAAGASNLNIACNAVSPPAAISVLPDISGGISIAPGASSDVTFSCSSAVAGFYTLDYVCDYTTDGSDLPMGVPVGASYTYTCDVRDPESVVTVTPASGSTLSGIVSPGGTATLQVVFGETADETIDGELNSCTLGDGTNFAITSPTFPGGPYAIPSGGTLPVVVEGTDPGGVESITDTLTCIYYDSDSDEGGVTVTYELLLTVGGNAGFTVTKTFTDGRTDEVDVTLTCNGGLPLEQDFTIAGDGPGVTFVVSNVESGPTCEVTESGGPDGYTAVMNGGLGCVFEDVQPGGEYTCAIENIANPGMFTVHKEWLVTEPADDDDFRKIAELWVFCDKPIIGSESGIEGDVPMAPPIYGHGYPVLGDGYVTAYVDTSTGPANCTGAEGVFGYENPPSGVEAMSDCPPAINDVNQGIPEFTDPSTWIEVEAGGSEECTITNTLFFEGIPTLSQWGMAIMALLMLGMGMVGFRRFA